ncbi:MAG: tetratricopeptide repeat protein [Synergistaceae bacterium]|nr:tetratricopeptide repeat protein [Synergistaceae bacterium]
MQEKVTAVQNNESGRTVHGEKRNYNPELRSVTKIVKMLNTRYNSEALTFKTVSDWLVSEGYWVKETGRTKPTAKGLESGMLMQKCCLNGKEFESVYCDRKMQKLISDKFSTFFTAVSEKAAQSVKIEPMAKTWEVLANSYYGAGSYKEAAECYRKTIECLRA